MNILILSDISIIAWLNTVIALLGLFVAVIALLMTRKANKSASEANDLSHDANSLATEANQYASRALQLQEDESAVRLIVKPQILLVVGLDDESEDDRQPRPVVEVLNLSAFPVTIRAIHFKRNDDTYFYWKNPDIANPFGKLPARLPAKESLTAVGNPTTFKSLEFFATVTAAVAYTSCGEQIEGMTDQWKEEVRRLLDQDSSSVFGN